MSLSLKPSHATVKAYYETLGQFGQLYIDHEGAVRSAFQTLLAKCGQKASPKLTLVPEYRIERARSSVIVDGALVDLYHLPHGYWEAKDEKDDLAREVQRKLDKGYPRDGPPKILGGMIRSRIIPPKQRRTPEAVRLKAHPFKALK